MEDEKIIGLFWQRDQTAIRETEIKYGARLQRLSISILKDYEDAEESINDTYMKAWDTIPPQKPVFLFAYLAKICRFISFGRLDWKKAKKRNAQIVELTAEMELCIPDRHTQTVVDEAELGQLLSSFIQKLPEEKRLLFVRRYWYADSIQDIAGKYHMSESKVKTTLYRTRKLLKVYLEKEGVIL